MHRPLSKPLTQLIWSVSVAVVGLAVAANAWAQHCESMSGSSRTDCFIGRARILGQQSDIAAGTAQLRVDQEFLRTATGTSVQLKPQMAKSKHSPLEITGDAVLQHGRYHPGTTSTEPRWGRRA
jgi:hypothetical protein